MTLLCDEKVIRCNLRTRTRRISEANIQFGSNLCSTTLDKVRLTNERHSEWIERRWIDIDQLSRNNFNFAYTWFAIPRISRFKDNNELSITHSEFFVRDIRSQLLLKLQTMVNCLINYSNVERERERKSTMTLTKGINLPKITN